MRKLLLVLNLTMVLCASATAAYAEMVFHLDFAQDGAYENSQQLGLGDMVTIDLYVSNVPEPGLLTMGFLLNYDSLKLQLVGAPEVNSDLWLAGAVPAKVYPPPPGSVALSGFQFDGNPQSGDNIKLMTVTFLRIAAGNAPVGLVELTYENLDHSVSNPDSFVLLDGTVLDGEISTPITLGTITPVLLGDFNGDQDVDGQDLASLAHNACNGICPSLADFAGKYGFGL